MCLLQPSTTPPQSLVEVFQRLHERALAAGPELLFGATVLLIFWLSAAIGRRLIAVAAPHAHADTGVVLLLSRVYYYSVLIFGLVTALGAAGLNVSALVTGLGLTGFALGFALKDVLSNLLSGIMLLVYRPFSIGDRIRMGEFAGTIQMIRMRDTLVRADDHYQIVIPNTKLITEVVVNYGPVPAGTATPPGPGSSARAPAPAAVGQSEEADAPAEPGVESADV